MYNYECIRVTRTTWNAGLCSFIMTMLDLFVYCFRSNLIPIVDWSDVNNSTFHSEQSLNKTNPWLDYFYQPYFIDKDLCDYKKLRTIEWNPLFHGLSWNNTDEMCRTFGKMFIHPKDDIAKMVEDFWYRNLMGKNVVGVRLRGTDYINCKPSHHQRQPGIDDVIKDLETYVAENKIDKIFLTTESNAYKEKITNRFGDMVCSNETIFIDNDSQTFNCNYIKNNYDYDSIVKMNKEYIASIFILSRCQNVITSNSNAYLLYRCLRKTPPKYEYVYNLGFYS